MKLIRQSFTLLLSLFIVLAIISTPLAYYEALILALIIITSVILMVIRGKKNAFYSWSNKEVFCIILVVLIAVFLTGGFESNLIFLLYFLILDLAFLFEPITVFVLVFGLIVIFLPEMRQGNFISNTLKLASFVLVSPIAYLLGRQFKKRIEPKTKLHENREKVSLEEDSTNPDRENVLHNA